MQGHFGVPRESVLGHIREWKRGKVAWQKTQGVAHWYIPRIRVLGRVGNARKASYKSWNARKASYKSLPKDPRDGTHAHPRYLSVRSPQGR